MNTITIDVFNEWHPRFDMCAEATSKYVRTLLFRPDFTSNTFTYIVTIRDCVNRVTKEFEFAELKSAVECYNSFGGD